MNCMIKTYIGIIVHHKKFSHLPAALGKVYNNITNHSWRGKKKKASSCTDTQSMRKDKNFKNKSSNTKELSSKGRKVSWSLLIAR